MSAWPVTKAPEPRYCSFCGRSEHEVDVLIAGPCSVFICDEDVANTAEIIAAKKRQRLAAGRAALASTRGDPDV